MTAARVRTGYAQTTTAFLGMIAGLTATALAGARLEMRPDPKVPVGGYAPNTIVKVHVFLVNTGDPPGMIPVRFFTFDVADTSPELTLRVVDSGMCCCPTYFEWALECTAWCIVCPDPHDLSWVCPLPISDPWCNIYWDGNADLGYFDVDVGTEGGMLDVMNADDPSPDAGASLVFGFGGPGDPITIWRAFTGELTGGVIELPVNQGVAPAIVASDPPSNAIDAGQPLCGGEWLPCGWDEMELSFDGAVAGIEALDFEVTEEGGSGTVPEVASVEPIGDQTLRVVFTGIIEPGAWTTIRHVPSDTSVRLGFLPADANGDGTSSPVDILALIDSLNGVISRPIWSTDIDRSGLATPADILRLIDLLNGADAFDPWNGVSLPG